LFPAGAFTGAYAVSHLLRGRAQRFARITAAPPAPEPPPRPHHSRPGAGSPATPLVWLTPFDKFLSRNLVSGTVLRKNPGKEE
jgi:hypothetical protein